MSLPGRPASRLPLKPLLLVLGAAATVYAVLLAVFAETSPLAPLKALASLAGLQAIALCLLNYLLRGLRWRLWMAHYGRPLKILEALRLYLAGYTFTPTPGNVGEAARGLLLARNPLSATQSLAIFGAERLADLLCLLLLCTPALLWLLKHSAFEGMAGWLVSFTYATSTFVSLTLLFVSTWDEALVTGKGF